MSVQQECSKEEDYDDFMKKAQAKFEERKTILKNATPSTRDKLMVQSKVEVLQEKDDLKDKPVTRIPVVEWKTPTKQTKPIDRADQSVKENINKFERMASGSKIGGEQKEDYKAVSVKEMKRRFENGSTAVFPGPGPNPPKSPKVAMPSSPNRFGVQSPLKVVTSPLKVVTKSPATRTPSIVYETPERTEEPQPPCLIALAEVVEEDQLDGNKEEASIEVPLPPASPATLFGERLRQTMEPITPRRARLMDEINEDFQKHSRSLPRRPSRIMSFGDSSNETDEDDSVLVSLKEYRQGTLNRKAGTSSDDNFVEKLTYAPALPVDTTDSNAPKRNTDRVRQLEEFIDICTTQYEQAKKALTLIINKSERNEGEFVAASHILLNHRVVLDASLRVQTKLCKKAVKKLPEMRSAFTFKSVSFELNPEFLHDVCSEGSSCYFTVVIAHNESTRSSAPIPYQANARGRITMDDFYCAIDNVEPGFEIYVEIYMLQIPKPTTEKRHTFVDTVGTLLRGEKQRSSTEPRMMDSHFKRIGIAIINHANMNLRNIEARTVEPLAPRFDVIYDHHVMESSHRLEGYLRRFETVAGVGNWNMEYMTFNNWFLDSWPTQRDKLEDKPATRSISLRRCLDVEEVSDSACYSHAFFILYEAEDGQKQKLLLAARSKEEQEQWLKLLKSFVDGLKYWG